MRSLLPLCLLALLPGLVVAADKKEKDNIDPIKIIVLDRKEPVEYRKDIEPIFYKRCVVCHSGNMPESKFDLSTYDKLIKGGKGGSPIQPGRANDSRLYILSSKMEKPLMPPKT